MSDDLIVDLSQAEVGDTVVFQHGGRMPIGRILSFEVESNEGTNTGYSLWVGKSQWAELIGRFSVNGINERHPHQNAYCQIVAIEKHHCLYKTGDENAPEVIKDRNGEVVLSLCRRCGKGEAELRGECK